MKNKVLLICALLCCSLLVGCESAPEVTPTHTAEDLEQVAAENHELEVSSAYEEGFEAGKSVGYDDGFSDGFVVGYNDGWSDAFLEAKTSPEPVEESRIDAALALRQWQRKFAVETTEPVTTTEPAETTTPVATVVYVTKTGTNYHSDGCAYLAQSKLARSLEVAVSMGYAPCSKCNPPQ